MAAKAQTRRETCDECNRETPHSLRIEVRTESEDPEKVRRFSREPYRVAECQSCGLETSERWNNA